MRTTNDNLRYWACPECGCTDVQCCGWIEVNTNKPTNDEGPIDDYFCPQCSANGYEGLTSQLEETDTLKPCEVTP